MRERTLTGVEVQNRRIMRPVARSNAASFVYLHNHLGAVSINTRVATEGNRESQSLLKRRSKRSSIKAVATPRATFAPETIMETVQLFTFSSCYDSLLMTVFFSE